MAAASVAPKIAFVHLMRTGGTSLSAELRRTLMLTHRVCDSWFQGFGRDWTAQEMRNFAASREPIFVHNHVVNWNAGLVQSFREAGFFVFGLVRPVGDQLCSLYHLFRRREPDVDVGTLDEFLQAQLRGESILDIGHRDWAVPEWWRSIQPWGCLVRPSASSAEDDSRRELWQVRLPFAAQLGLSGFIDRFECRNASANLGFNFYLREGQITAETAELLKRSDYQRRYREVAEWIDRAKSTGRSSPFPSHAPATGSPST